MGLHTDYRNDLLLLVWRAEQNLCDSVHSLFSEISYYFIPELDQKLFIYELFASLITQHPVFIQTNSRSYIWIALKWVTLPVVFMSLQEFLDPWSGRDHSYFEKLQLLFLLSTADKTSNILKRKKKNKNRNCTPTEQNSQKTELLQISFFFFFSFRMKSVVKMWVAEVEDP